MKRNVLAILILFGLGLMFTVGPGAKVNPAGAASNADIRLLERQRADAAEPVYVQREAEPGGGGAQPGMPIEEEQGQPGGAQPPEQQYPDEQQGEPGGQQYQQPEGRQGEEISPAEPVGEREYGWGYAWWWWIIIGGIIVFFIVIFSAWGGWGGGGGPKDEGPPPAGHV